jgi:hypothetical protein
MAAVRPTDDLAKRIPRAPGLLAEHVISADDDPAADDWTTAALIDQWGRAHAVRARTTLGRERGEATIAVLEASVSRVHAELRFDRAAACWRVRDLGSTNGTFVEGRPLDGETELGDHALLGVGNVGFVFVLDGDSTTAHHVTRSLRETVRVGAAHDVWQELQLEAPASGEGGVVGFRGRTLRLGITQYALLELLTTRHREQADLGAELRGFVRAIDILAHVPWDTPHPEDDNVKQLVRRLRRSLASVGLDQAIESRHGFGYRLVASPEITAPRSS